MHRKQQNSSYQNSSRLKANKSRTSIKDKLQDQIEVASAYSSIDRSLRKSMGMVVPKTMTGGMATNKNSSFEDSQPTRLRISNVEESLS